MCMNVFQMVLVAITGTAIAALVRTVRPELALILSIGTGLIVLGAALGPLTGITEKLGELMRTYGLSEGMLSALIKIVGVAFLSQFGADACRDAGSASVADKVELFGRVAILALAAPAAIATVSEAAGLLDGAF